MLYLWLFSMHGRYPGLNVLRYETFRSVLAGLAAAHARSGRTVAVAGGEERQ